MSLPKYYSQDFLQLCPNLEAGEETQAAQSNNDVLKSLTPALTNLPSSAYRWQKKLTSSIKKNVNRKSPKQTPRHRWSLLVEVGWDGGGWYLLIMIYFAFKNTVLTVPSSCDDIQ